MNRTELLDRYAAGERAFHYADLSGADLSGADLSGADLGGAYLRGACLCDANLGDANLSGADLSGADLGGAYLCDADLSGADLGGADLGGADLYGADLSHADLGGADLGGANLGGADLSGADLGGADLGGADLSGAYLYGADLYGADLSGAQNVAVNSHDAIAEILRHAAGMRYDRLQVAGLPLVSRSWCWNAYQRIALDHWPVDLRRWIVATLSAAGPQFVKQFTVTPFLTPDEMASETVTIGTTEGSMSNGHNEHE